MSTGAYESEGVALQRALVWMLFVAAAADHVRWTLQGNLDDAGGIDFGAVASAARRGREPVAEALRAIGVPPDARVRARCPLRSRCALSAPDGFRRRRRLTTGCSLCTDSASKNLGRERAHQPIG